MGKDEKQLDLEQRTQLIQKTQKSAVQKPLRVWVKNELKQENFLKVH